MPKKFNTFIEYIWEKKNNRIREKDSPARNMECMFWLFFNWPLEYNRFHWNVNASKKYISNVNLTHWMSLWFQLHGWLLLLFFFLSSFCPSRNLQIESIQYKIGMDCCGYLLYHVSFVLVTAYTHIYHFSVHHLALFISIWLSFFCVFLFCLALHRIRFTSL